MSMAAHVLGFANLYWNLDCTMNYEVNPVHHILLVLRAYTVYAFRCFHVFFRTRPSNNTWDLSFAHGVLARVYLPCLPPWERIHGCGVLGCEMSIKLSCSFPDTRVRPLSLPISPGMWHFFCRYTIYKQKRPTGCIPFYYSLKRRLQGFPVKIKDDLSLLAAT